MFGNVNKHIKCKQRIWWRSEQKSNIESTSYDSLTLRRKSNRNPRFFSLLAYQGSSSLKRWKWKNSSESRTKVERKNAFSRFHPEAENRLEIDLKSEAEIWGGNLKRKSEEEIWSGKSGGAEEDAWEKKRGRKIEKAFKVRFLICGVTKGKKAWEKPWKKETTMAP